MEKIKVSLKNDAKILDALCPHFGNQTISKIILRFTILRLPHRCGVAVFG
jgi:hypothetical protein